MAVSFDTEIQFLKGIGEKRAGLLHKLGIDTVGDLVNHYPRDYIDLTEPVSVLHADPNEPWCHPGHGPLQIRGTAHPQGAFGL